MKTYNKIKSAALGILLLPLAGYAQGQSARTAMLARIDSVLYRYQSACSMTEPGKQDQISEKTADDFLSLFTGNAIMYDDVNFRYLDNGDTKDAAALTERKPLEYVEKLKKNYPTGIRVRFTAMNITYDRFNAGTVEVVYRKSVSGMTATGLEVEKRDTVTLTLEVNLNQGSVRIARISRVKSNFNILNDKDHDLVPDKDDQCPELTGPAPKGCPPPSRLWIDAGPGLTMGSLSFESQTVETLPFKDVYTATSTISALPTASVKPGFNFGANAQYFLGEKAQWGVGLGLAYHSFSTDIILDKYKVEYRAKGVEQNSATGEYRRIVTAQKMEEELRFGYLSIPLTLQWQTRQGRKFGFGIGAGPVMNILASGKTTSSGVFDYEAVFSNYGGGWNYAPKTTPGDWVITREAVLKSSGGDEQRMYDRFMQYNSRPTDRVDVALNKAQSKEDEFSFQPSFGFVVRPSFRYTIGEGQEVIASCFYMMGSNPNPDYNNSITDGTDQFRTTMASTRKLSYTLFGFSLGYRFSFQKSNNQKLW